MGALWAATVVLRMSVSKDKPDELLFQSGQRSSYFWADLPDQFIDVKQWEDAVRMGLGQYVGKIDIEYVKV